MEPHGSGASGAPPPEIAPRAAGRRRALWLGSAAVLALGGYLLAGRDSSPSRPLAPADVNKLVDAKLQDALTEIQSAPARSALVYRAILPSIVVVQTDRPGASVGDVSGLGSGVVINDRGQVLTALHVVDGARRVTVSFADGTQATAEIAATDKDHDIAVLAPNSLPDVVVPAVLGGGGRVGDEAFAVGHPLGLVGSLTAGVISGLDRSIPRKDGGKIEGLIQFDAAVNPGNSGGPLLNRAGQVIGIVTALANASKDGYFIGIGYAVPIGTAGGAAQAPPK